MTRMISIEPVGIRDSGFGIRDSFGSMGSQVRVFAPVQGSEVPVEGNFVPIRHMSSARKAARESMQNLADARCESIRSHRLLRAHEFQPHREFELGLAFRVRTQGDHDVTAICRSFVAMAFGDI